MKLINRIFLYAILLSTIVGTILYKAPAAASSPVQVRFLPMAETRELTPKEYLYVHYPDVAEDLEQVIFCESGWKPAARSQSSTATGLAQFLSSTWRSTRLSMGRDPALDLRLDPYEMIDTTVYLWNKGRGAGHWSASEGCWRHL